MESRTMNGNSPCAARVPPTTGLGAALALTGWRLTTARAAAPATAVLLRKENSFFNRLPFPGGWITHGRSMTCPSAGSGVRYLSERCVKYEDPLHRPQGAETRH